MPFSALNQSLHKVLNGKEGVILTIYGRAGSGKRTIIDRVFKTRDNIEFVELDGKFTSLQEVKAELKNVYDISKEVSLKNSYFNQIAANLATKLYPLISAKNSRFRYVQFRCSTHIVCE